MSIYVIKSLKRKGWAKLHGVRFIITASIKVLIYVHILFVLIEIFIHVDVCYKYI